MKCGTVVGPGSIPVEVCECLEEVAEEFLTGLFNKIFESERMPKEWRGRAHF